MLLAGFSSTEWLGGDERYKVGGSKGFLGLPGESLFEAVPPPKQLRLLLTHQHSPAPHPQTAFCCSHGGNRKIRWKDDPRPGVFPRSPAQGSLKGASKCMTENQARTARARPKDLWCQAGWGGPHLGPSQLGHHVQEREALWSLRKEMESRGWEASSGEC